MTASEIIARARSASDLPSSKFVSHQDELDSLNECWKDIYSLLVENDDDYYVTETTLTLNTTTAVAGANNEYLVPLPADFLKVRYLDFRGYTDWMPMKKFNLGMKDNQPGDPYYRIKGSSLWVIGGSVPTTGLTMRLGYYPAPATLTCPQASLSYGTSYAPNLFPLITHPGYAPYLQQIVYAYNGTGIRSESITNSTVSAPVALFTDSGAVTNLVYYKGTLYWIRGGLIWYKATDLTVLFTVPTQATTPTGVTSFSILNNVIYYTNATQVRSCNLTGGADALVTATAGTSVAAVFISGVTTVFYINASNALVAVSPATTLFASGISEVQSDGTYLYIADTTGALRKLAVTVTATVTVSSDTTVATDILDFGAPVLDAGQVPAIPIIPLITANAQTLLGFDASVNYNFTFPNNLAPEIMAWKSAVDYRTKAGADITAHLMKLGHQSNASEGSAVGLWARFEQTIKRDAYQPERIRNVYPSVSWAR